MDYLSSVSMFEGSLVPILSPIVVYFIGKVAMLIRFIRPLLFAFLRISLVCNFNLQILKVNKFPYGSNRVHLVVKKLFHDRIASHSPIPPLLGNDRFDAVYSSYL